MPIGRGPENPEKGRRQSRKNRGRDRDPQMPIGPSRQSSKSQGRDRDPEMLIDSNQQSRKGKGKDRDAEMPIVRDPETPIGSSRSKKGRRQSRKSKGRDRNPEMPIDSSQQSREGKGKDRDPEMLIDSSQGKGVDDGQNTQKEQVTESSSESSEEENCEICGDNSHCPGVCNYLVYIPPNTQPVNKEKYKVVCFCGLAVRDDGEFTCDSCLPGAPKAVSLKSDVFPPEEFGPEPSGYYPELEKLIENHKKFMAAPCREKGEGNCKYYVPDTEIE